MSGSSPWLPPSLPREHGAWAMLLAPLVLGSAAARSVTAASLLVGPAMLFGFLARYAALPVAVRLLGGKRIPREVVARRSLWTVLYLLASAASLAGAVVLTETSARRGALAMALVAGLLAAAHTALALMGWDRTIVGEIVGMIGLSVSAPFVIAAAGRPVDRRALGAAALAFFYFLSSLAFVRAYRAIAAARGPAPAGDDDGDANDRRRRAVAGCLQAHSVILLALVALYARGSVPALSLAAFALVGARTLLGLIAPPENLRVLGLREIGVAAGFVVVASIGLGLQG